MATSRKEVISRKKNCNLILGRLIVIFVSINVAKSEKSSLYKASDPMVQFTNDTIMKHLTRSNNVWIVEFYSSWCGHCQTFAPRWLRLAWELKNWNRYVNVGVLDCAAEKNLDTCKAFNIEAYPTIRFFDVNWKNSSTGDKTKMGITYDGDKDIKHIRRGLIDHVEKQKDKDFDKSDIPFNFIGLKEINQLMSLRQKTKLRYLALVFEEPESYTGKILTMDASKCKKLVVRRVSYMNSELATKFNALVSPALILITLVDGEFKELSRHNRTHVGFLNALNKVADIIQTPPVEKKDTGPKIIDELEAEKAANVTSEVFMMDIVSSVSFSLRREVPKKETIQGEALDVLKNYVNLLHECLPAEKYLSNFIRKLDEWLKSKDHENKLESEKYLKYIEEHQEWDSYVPTKIEWRGCEGSQTRYRGYPCGLWTLFHALTVNCGTKNAELTGLEVLKRLRGFIDHFFGCRYCRDHFVKMAKNVDEEVASHDDGILWLWEGHNRVNARLKTDVSSDPLFPKIQFPPDNMCEECWKPTTRSNTIKTNPGYGAPETNWNKRVVLEFLKEHYGPDNIRIKDKVKVGDVAPDNADAVSPRFKYKFYSRRSSPASFAFIGLSHIDMSMCVVLYVAVICSLAALYIYFIQRRKKKLWKHYV